MVVIALLALAATAATMGIGSLTHGNLRSSAMLVAAGVRAGYGHAATSGRTVRLVLDIEQNKVWLEESDDRVVLDREDETGAGGAAETAPPQEEGAAPAEDGEAPAAEIEAPASPAPLDARGRRRARFRPIPGRRGEPRSPKGSVKLVAVYNAHERGRQETGRHALYFFSGGQTERAVVQLADPSGEVYSVRVHPLTGRARIFAEAIEPQADLYERETEEEGEAPL